MNTILKAAPPMAQRREDFLEDHLIPTLHREYLVGVIAEAESLMRECWADAIDWSDGEPDTNFALAQRAKADFFSSKEQPMLQLKERLTCALEKAEAADRISAQIIAQRDKAVTDRDAEIMSLKEQLVEAKFNAAAATALAKSLMKG